MYYSQSNATLGSPGAVPGNSSMTSVCDRYLGVYGSSQSSGGEPIAHSAGPAFHRSVGSSGNAPIHRSDPGRRGLFSKAAVPSNAVQRGYAQAVALLSKDETFDPTVPVKCEEKADNDLHDPRATIGAEQNSLYLTMKNDKMIYAKNVKEVMEMAAFIWQNLYKVTVPMIRIPVERKEFFYFRMMSLEDKLKVMTMCDSKTAKKNKKLQFMGKMTLIKDLPVAPLPFLVAQPGTREGALDALMPLRGIPYEDQVAARSDLLKSMLKKVVLSTRKALSMPAGTAIPDGSFYDEPELKEFIPMGTSTGYARFTTVEFGEHPSTGNPTPGVRVYYGFDEVPMVYFLPLEDCTHISPAIVKTVNDLFEYLAYEGFATFDPKHGQGQSIVQLRIMMSTSGRMIVTVELALDDNFTGSFEKVVAKNNTDTRPLYSPMPEPAVIPEYPFMKENSLDVVPPIRDLMQFGGFDHLCLIRPALQRFHQQYGPSLGVEGIYITWYYVNERPVEWNRHSKIWHHACGSEFVSEFVMDTTLPMYPHICSIHFPHTQAFPKILSEIAEKTKVNGSSRVIVFSEYLFLADFFGQKCSRTILIKNQMTDHEQEYLLTTLPPNAIKFVSPSAKPTVDALEPGGDLVVIWGENRKEKILRKIGLANYSLVVFVRDGLKRVKKDKEDTFASLVTISRCLFPYMVLEGAVAIDVEPQGSTMPAVISFFSKSGSPFFGRASQSQVRVPCPLPAPAHGVFSSISVNPIPATVTDDRIPSPPPPPIIGSLPEYKLSSHPASFSQSPYSRTPQQPNDIDLFGLRERQHGLGLSYGQPSTPGDKVGSDRAIDDSERCTGQGNRFERLPPDTGKRRLQAESSLGQQRTPWRKIEQKSAFPEKFDPQSSWGNKLEQRPTPGSKHEHSSTPGDRFNHWDAPGEKCDFRTSPGNNAERLTTPENNKEQRQTPGRKIEQKSTFSEKFDPQSSWGSEFEQRPTPGSKHEHSSTPGDRFYHRDAPGEKIDLRTSPRNNVERLTTPENNKEQRQTPVEGLEPRPSLGGFGLEPLLGGVFGSKWPPDNFGPKWPPDHFGPCYDVPAVVKPDENKINSSSSRTNLPSQSTNEPTNAVDREEEIMDFVWRNGGHKEIEKMTPDRSLSSWKMLYNLQKSLRNQRNKGVITFYPFWYHKYLYEYEPDVELPDEVKRPPSLVRDPKPPTASIPTIPPPSTATTTARISTTIGVEPPAKVSRLDGATPNVGPPSISGSRQYNQPTDVDSDEDDSKGETNKIYDVQHVCEYIWKNGGHTNVLKMKLDQSVEGWRLLRNIQKAARNRKRNGLHANFPHWYQTVYLPQFEPYVVLPNLPLPGPSQTTDNKQQQ